MCRGLEDRVSIKSIEASDHVKGWYKALVMLESRGIRDRSLAAEFWDMWLSWPKRMDRLKLRWRLSCQAPVSA